MALTNVTSSWTTERTERLTALWADGQSANQIAVELGGVSRNACIGKVHRLGLPMRMKPNRKPVVRKPRVHQALARRIAERAKRAEAAPLPIPAAEPTPRVQRCTIFELDNSTCRYPEGDPGTPGFFFCGGPANNAAGQVYCTKHSALCFNGPPKKPRHEFIGRG